MFRRLIAALSLLVVCPWLAGGEIEPVAPGPFAVATTNLQVRPQAGAKAMFDFLNGKVSAEGTKYLTDILVHPDAVPTVQVAIPDDRKRYGAHAGQRLPLVLLVVYPTRRDNPRYDYLYPYTETGDALFTHMQQPGDKPVFADPAAKYPLVVYSGGYNTHGLWHLAHLKALAAHGYIVVDMFHGDGRGADFPLNLALRTVELRATLDFILQHPDFAPAIDADRIGAEGMSGGGHTILAAMGGTDPAGRMADSADPRIKAGFGLVPFMGGSVGIWPFKMDFWFFGEDHAGLNRMSRPFLAVYGGKDSNVPPEGVESGVRAMAGPASAVMLDHEPHLVSNASNVDIRTWETLFFDAWLKDDATARKKLESGTSVRGGVPDHKTVQQAPAAKR
jgi:dienelactone hydrolase